MADSNLDVAVHVRTQLQQALADFRRLDQSLGKAGLTADRCSPRERE